MTEVLTADKLSRLTGRGAATCARMLKDCGQSTLAYRNLGADEEEHTAEKVERVIREQELRVSGDDDASIWKLGWGEVADSLKDREITTESLRPQYFRGEPTCRLFGRYVRPAATTFEYDVGLVLRRLIFDEFLDDIAATVEFGCGTGINLLLLAQQFPHMKLTGCDWAPQSRTILAQMARQMERPIEGHDFNMLTASGWAGDTIDRQTAVLTVHAMEQLGPHWRAFADHLIARRPAVVLHIEPILELYDPSSAFDDRAKRYHLKRRYLDGYYSYLMQRQRSGQSEILAARRISFGGLFHEAYSVIAWRP
jgi:hypothetical protein